MSTGKAILRFVLFLRRDLLSLVLVLFSLLAFDFFLGRWIATFLLLAYLLSRPPALTWLRAHHLRIPALSFRLVVFLYGASIAALVIAFTRFVLPPFWFIGIPIFLLALVPRLLRVISFKHYILLLFNFYVLLSRFLFHPGFSDFLLSRIDDPPYLTPVIVSQDEALSCAGTTYPVSHPPVWMRKVNVYRDGALITATNGHEHLVQREQNVAGIVARLNGKSCRLQWFCETYCHDLIFDEGASRYFASRHNEREVLTLDEDLNIVNRTTLPEGIVDLFLDVSSSGERRLLALSFLHGKIYVLDPDNLQRLSTHTYSPFILNYNFSKLDVAKGRLYVACIHFPYIAAILDLNHMDRSRTGVLGLGSWGIDFQPGTPFFYVSDFFLGRLYKVDATSMKTVEHAYLRPGIRSVVYDAKRNRVYVGDYYLKDIFVLDAELKKIGTLRSNGKVTLMRISQEGDTLYTVGWKGVYAIDLPNALAMIDGPE